MEVLLAVGLGTLLIIVAVSTIVPALTIGRNIVPVQTGAALGMELMNNVRVWSEGDWHNMLALATGTANVYYINASTSPYVSVTGTQSVVVGTSTYMRSFRASDVYRTGGAVVTSGGTYDPSTKLVTVVYALPMGVTSSMSAYLTRHGDVLFDQTDWSGGPGVATPVSVIGTGFATSSNIDYATTTGSIYVAIPGY